MAESEHYLPLVVPKSIISWIGYNDATDQGIYGIIDHIPEAISKRALCQQWA